MRNSSEQAVPVVVRPACEKQILLLADVCFEMFSIKELRRPETIMGELQAAFPDVPENDISKAIGMALSWRRLLRSAGLPLH